MKARGSCQILALVLSIVASAALSGCDEAESNAKAEALELTDVAAYWAIRGQDEEQNHYIRPVIRFRVHNAGSDEVGYIQAMAVFKLESQPDEPWGSDFVYSVAEEPIPPGAASDVVTLRSDASFISKDAPEQMFANPKWEQVEIEVFVRVGPSNWKSAAELEVPKRIGAPGLEKFLTPEPDLPEPSESAPPKSETR